MQKLQKIKIPKLLLLFCFITCIGVWSCTKIDINKDSNSEYRIKNVNDFFKIPQNTEPMVLRVIDEIKNRNNKKEFISSFANDIGFPVWDKAIITITNGVSTSLNFANSSTPIDTFVYIPFVIDNSTSINGYILAKINTNIGLSYTLAQDYKLCSFEINSGDLNEASKLALRMMYLNKSVFNVSNYKITDTRLLSEDTVNKKIVSVNLDNTISTQYNFVSSISCSITITTTTTCIKACNTTVSSTMFCTNEWPGGGEPSPGGGGGGGSIPPNFPCTPVLNPNFTGLSSTGGSSVLPGGPLPPCPSPGSGWAPFQSLCSSSLNFIQGNDNSYWETYVSGLRFESGPNQINSYKAYYSLGNDITDYKMNEVIFPSPFGAGIPPKTPLEYLYDFFPSLMQPGSVDIYKIWDPTIQSYVWRFSKFAVQVISSRCSNLASIDVSLQYYGSASIPDFLPAQTAFRAKTSAFLKCFSPTIGTTCRLIPSTSANLSTASYSIGCL